jgi:Haem-binding domain
VKGALARVARIAALVLLVAFVAIQFVPYGWWHENPPVVSDAPWPDAQSRRIAHVSCYSCHSNETDWPPYAFVAPMSWLVRRDVQRGRDEFNFSDWDEYGEDADDAIEEIEEGNMPPRQYTLVHPDAKLTAAEAQVLANALNAMEPGEDEEEEEDD